MANAQALRNAADDADGAPVDPARIEAELTRIEATPEFARAPVMRRLLRFLVETTLAGGGAQLKAYSVAVDGLGRAHDFDSQSDSYPRVQVGRLRRMLASFYAQHGCREGVQIAVPQGSYLVTFADEPKPVAPAPSGAELEAERRARLERWRARIGLLVLLAFTITIALALGAWNWWENRFAAQHPDLTAAPTMAIEIGPEATGGPGAPLARSADAFLIDALRRSRLVRLHTGDANAHGNDYRLVAEVSSDDQPTLFLRLWRNDINRLLWSGVVRLPRSGGALQAAMTPAIVELVQPFGVIASDQRARRARDFAPGYACLLQFDQYRRARDHGTALLLDKCLLRTLAIEPHQPAAIAARSYLFVDAARFYGPPAIDHRWLERAATLAGQAIALDPYSPDAQFAMSRVAFAQGACARAEESGRRALALDPYNPDLIGRIGRYIAACGDPRGLQLVQHAIALDPDPPASFFSPLVLARIDAGDPAGALATASRMTRPSDISAGLYEITMAAALAANGKDAEAAAAWRRAAALDRAAGGDPDAIIGRWQFPKPQSDAILALLRKSGAIPPVAPAVEPGKTPEISAAATR